MTTPNLYFKCTGFSLEAIRDKSLLKLSLQMADGQIVVVDLNGELITKFQAKINRAITSVPGLAVWKGPSK
jgi:hypothetical protein